MTTLAAGPTIRRFFGPGTTESAIFALSILTGPLVSRALGDDGRGSIAAVVVPVQLLTWVFMLGIPYGAAMLVNELPRRALIDSAWRIAVLVNVPLAIIGWFTAPLLLDGHPSTTVTWFRIGMLGVILGLPATTAIHHRMISTGGTWRTSLAVNLHLLGYSVVVVILAVADRLTLTTALAAWIGSLVVASLAVIAVYRASPHGVGTAGTARRLATIGRPHALVTLATVSLGRLDQVFLAVMGTSASLGHYAIAVTAAQVSVPVTNGIASVVLPDSFTSPDTGVERSGIRFVLALSAGVAALTALTAPWLLPWVFGAEFDDAVPLLWLLLPGQVLFNTAWVANAGQLGRGHGSDAARAIGLAAVFSTILLAPAIHLFGAAGAAALTSISQGLFLLGVLRARRTRAAREATATTQEVPA